MHIINISLVAKLAIALSVLIYIHVSHAHTDVDTHADINSCSDKRAIDLYNQAIDSDDLKERVRLLKQAHTLCTADLTTLQFLGDSYFELGDYQQSASTYTHIFQRTTSMSERAKIALELMHIYDRLNDRLNVSKYAKFIKQQKYNGLVWDDEHEQSFQSLYQKNKQQMTDNPISANTLSNKIDEVIKTAEKDFGVVGVRQTACISWDMDVYFDYNSDTLTATGKNTLNQFVTMVRPNASSIDTLTINGHTDARGSAEYNQQLSQRRADAVAHYLKQAIPSMQSKIIANGLGETQLIFNEDTEKSHALNRRVEFDLAVAESSCK